MWCLRHRLPCLCGGDRSLTGLEFPECLGWLASKPQDSSVVSEFPAWKLQVCLTAPGFLVWTLDRAQLLLLGCQPSSCLPKGTFPKLILETREQFRYLSGHRSPQGNGGGGAEKSNIDPRGGKRGLVTCHGNVAAGNKLAAGRCGQAIDHGNDGDGVVPDQHHDLRTGLKYFGVIITASCTCQLLQIVPR